jgi:hypothetical protein
MHEDEIQQVLGQYLERDIALDVFRQWFAGAYAHVRQDPDASREASHLCNRIVGPLAEFSRGHRSEDALRAQLRMLSRPFAPIRATVKAKRVVFGESPSRTLSTNAPILLPLGA